MDGLDVWTAYYRANPVRFLIDYFGMEWIRPFQQVMITFMFRFTYFMTIASRGMGKSMIVAAFFMCVLYSLSGCASMYCSGTTWTVHQRFE